MLTIEERYLCDAEFHNLVDLLESMIRKYQFTPYEIREAAMLAAVRYETYKSPAIIFRGNDKESNHEA